MFLAKNTTEVMLYTPQGITLEGATSIIGETA